MPRKANHERSPREESRSEMWPLAPDAIVRTGSGFGRPVQRLQNSRRGSSQKERLQDGRCRAAIVRDDGRDQPPARRLALRSAGAWTQFGRPCEYFFKNRCSGQKQLLHPDSPDPLDDEERPATAERYFQAFYPKKPLPRFRNKR